VRAALQGLSARRNINVIRGGHTGPPLHSTITVGATLAASALRREYRAACVLQGCYATLTGCYATGDFNPRRHISKHWLFFLSHRAHTQVRPYKSFQGRARPARMLRDSFRAPRGPHARKICRQEEVGLLPHRTCRSANRSGYARPFFNNQQS